MTMEPHTPLIDTHTSRSQASDRRQTRSMMKDKTRSMVKGVKNRKRKKLRKKDYIYGTNKKPKKLASDEVIVAKKLKGKENDLKTDGIVDDKKN